MRHIRKGLNPVRIPFAIKTSDPVMREWVGEVREGMRALAARIPQASPLRIGGGGTGGNRFKFGGLYKDSENKWRVKIGEGTINYHEIFTRGDFVSRKSEAQYIRGVFPTIDGVRIDDASKPALELGERDAASVWVVAKKDKCGSSSTSSERLMISDRDEDPDIDSDEDAYLIAEFDVEETDGGGKKATEVYKFLQSDLVQDYSCDKGDQESDSWDGSDMDGSSDFVSQSSDMGGSTPSGSDSDDDDDGVPDACDVSVVAGWENIELCFPKVDGPEKCVPKFYDFRIRVAFKFPTPYGPTQCEGFAYAASLDGGIIINPGPSDTATEYRWRDDADRTLVWRVANPPACGTISVQWRFKPFGPLQGPLDPPVEDIGCCTKIEQKGSAVVILREYVTTGRWDASKTKLPPVCGCTCSSSATGSGSGSGGEEPPP